MKAESLSFKRYRGSQDIDIVFKGAGLYLIHGPNGSGKTSFLENMKSHLTAKEKSPNPVKEGESNSDNLMIFKDAQGNTAQVSKMIDEKSGKTKFSLIYNDQKKNKIGDITDIFKFNDMSADRFTALGLTKDGRREQLKYILNILKEEDKDEFETLQAKEEQIVDDRKVINKLVKENEIAVKNNTVSDEELEMLENKENADKLIKALNLKLSNLEKLQSDKDNLEKSKVSFKANVETAIMQLHDDFDTDVLNQFNEIVKKIEDNINKEIEAIGEISSTEEIEQRISKGNEVVKKITEISNKQSVLESHKKTLKENKKKQDEYNSDLTIIREKLENFFATKETPIPELVVGTLDDGLKVKTDRGTFPFNEDSLSTSELMFITLKIMYFANKEVDIIFLGKLESFDDNKTKTLIEFAMKYDLQIIADQVDKKGTAFVIDILWDMDEAENLVNIPLEKREPVSIPDKIEKRKSKGKIKEEKKIIKESKPKEDAKKIEDDFLSKDSLF